MLQNTGGVLIGRTAILLPESKNEEQTAAIKATTSSADIHILNVESDMLKTGEVLAMISCHQEPKFSYRGEALEKDRLSCANGQVHLMPLRLMARSMTKPKTYSENQKTATKFSRTLARTWLLDKGCGCPEISQEDQWSRVTVDQPPSHLASGSRENANKEGTSFTVEWPRKYSVVPRPFFSKTEPMILLSLFQLQLNIIRFATRRSSDDSKDDGVIKQENQKALHPPPIPSEVCKDFLMSYDSSQNEIIRDANGDIQPTAIYPTPSDGLVSHQTPASNAYDSPQVYLSQQQDSHVPSLQPTRITRQDSSGQPSELQARDQSPQPEHRKDQTFGPTIIAEDDFEFFDQPLLPIQTNANTARTEYHRPRKESNDDALIMPDRAHEVRQGKSKKPPPLKNTDAQGGGQATTLNDQMDVDDSEFNTSGKVLSSPLTRQIINNRIKSINDVNLKYTRNGIYHDVMELRSPKKSEEDQNISRVPHLGLPASNSSDSESTDSMLSSESNSDSESLTYNPDILKQEDKDSDFDGSRVDLDGDRGYPKHEAREHLLDLNKTKKFFSSLDMKHSKGLSEDFAAAYTWSDLGWLFVDLEQQNKIDTIQLMTSQLLQARREGSDRGTTIFDLQQTIADVLPETNQFDLISLAVPPPRPNTHTSHHASSKSE